ncbi:MAG: HAD family hydrolase [Pyrinomonadaceae bacterium]|nr:HAD family hydrolase [Pyrinomonadaceae bacterium]
MSNPTKPAIFVDRDGTLIEEVDHLSNVDDLRLYSYTREAVLMAKDHGYLVIVVTNQSGIGRSYFDEAAMSSIHERIQLDLDGAIDGFYFCPHLPDAGCDCRKPATGMINAAQADFDIDMSGSWIIGDKSLDVLTGVNAGIRSALVLTGYGKGHRERSLGHADLIENDLLSAVRAILNERSGQS